MNLSGGFFMIGKNDYKEKVRIMGGKKTRKKIQIKFICCRGASRRWRGLYYRAWPKNVGKHRHTVSQLETKIRLTVCFL